MENKSPSLREALIKARSLLAGGWSEPESLDSGGHACAFNDEGVHRFCLADALVAANAPWDSAVKALEAIALPTKVAFDRAIDQCLAAPERMEPKAAVQTFHALKLDHNVWIDLFDWAKEQHPRLPVLLQVFDRAISQCPEILQ